MILNECLLYDELTEMQQQIVKENKTSLLNNESVEFEEYGQNYEIYISETKCPVTNENYYVISECQ